MSNISKVNASMIDGRFIVRLAGTVSAGMSTGGAAIEGPMGPTGPAGPAGASGGSNTFVGVGASLPASGTQGQAFYNTTDGKLYIYNSGQWVSASAVNTPNAVAGAVEIVSALPASGTSGQVVYNKTDDKLYEWTGSAWTAAVPSITSTQITDGSISTQKLATNSITSDKISANSIIAGKIAVGAVGASEIAANAITADKIASNSITAGKLAAGSVTTSTLAVGAITADVLTPSANSLTANGVKFWLGGDSMIFQQKVCFLLDRQVGGSHPMCVSNVKDTSGAAGAYFLGGQTGSGFMAVGGLSSDYMSASPTYRSSLQAGLAEGNIHFGFNTNSSGSNGIAGRFAHYSTNPLIIGGNNVLTKSVDVCTSTYGVQLYGAQIAAFTGAHDGVYAKADPVPEIGDLVVDHAVLHMTSVNDAITQLKLSSKPSQKAVLGVVSQICPDTHIPSAFTKFDTVLDDAGNQVVKYVFDPAFANIGDTNIFLGINAVGEGGINVCGEGGDFEAGDLIVASSMPGKGMKQADDIVRSYTVAKIRENVTFATAEEVKMVACIYMCG